MDKYLNESYRKGCRKCLVNSIYNFLIKTKYPKNYLAFMIKSWHYTFPYMTMFVFLFAPLWMGFILTLVLFIFTILYIYLKGCFVSHLEYKLCKKNFINNAVSIKKNCFAHSSFNSQKQRTQKIPFTDSIIF